jgi:hypothetical protein
MSEVIYVNFGRAPDPLVQTEPVGWQEFLRGVESELDPDDVQDLFMAIQDAHAYEQSDEVIQALATAYFLEQGII